MLGSLGSSIGRVPLGVFDDRTLLRIRESLFASCRSLHHLLSSEPSEAIHSFYVVMNPTRCQHHRRGSLCSMEKKVVVVVVVVVVNVGSAFAS